MERLLCLLIGYGFGLFQTAYIYGKMHGVDIRQHGSGNSGTTNTLRTFGTKAGMLVLAGDIVKCILAIVICSFLFGSGRPELNLLFKIYAAAGAILGHNFPFYMGFKGGKGIAATGGLILAFHPWFVPMGVLIFFTVFFTLHYVSLGSLLVYVGFLVQLIVFGQMGWFPGMSQIHLFEMYGVAGFLAAMAFYKHRANIGRLVRGEERKTYLGSKGKNRKEK